MAHFFLKKLINFRSDMKIYFHHNIHMAFAIKWSLLATEINAHEGLFSICLTF